MSQTPDHLTSPDFDGSLLLGEPSQSPPPAELYDGTVSLKKLVAGGFRNRTLIATFTLGASLVAVGAAVMEPNTYVSSAAILFETGGEGLQINPLLEGNRSIISMAANAPHILYSPDLASRVVERLGAELILKPYEPPLEAEGLMAPFKSFIFSLQRKIHAVGDDVEYLDAEAVEALLGGIEVITPQDDSGVFYVEYSAYSGTDAQQILTVYLEEAKKMHQEVYGDQHQMEIEMAIYEDTKKDYKKALTAYDEFLKSTEIVDFDYELETRQEALRELRAAHEELVTLDLEQRTRLEHLTAKLETLEHVIQRETTVVVDNPALEPLRQAIEERLQMEIEMRTQVQPGDQALAQLQEAIEGLKARLAEEEKNPSSLKTEIEVIPNPQYEEIQSQIYQLEVDIEVTAASIEPARAKIGPAEEALARITDLNDEHTEVLRELEQTDTRLIAAEENVSLAKVKQEMQGRAFSSVKLLNTPSFPLDRAGPQRAKTVGVGMILGLLLGVGLSFLRTILDGTVRSLEDLEQISDVPVLAAVPKLDRRNLTRHLKARVLGC